MFKSRKSHDLPEINTTSLPDIIFMLLFFFMVVTVIKKDETDNNIKVPAVEYAELLKKGEVTAVGLFSEGGLLQYSFGDKTFNDITKLESALHDNFLSDGATKVKFVADRTVAMADINAVKKALQSNQYFQVDYLVIK